MADKPYASLLRSLMHAQACTRPDLAFAVSMLRRFQSNPGQAHWVAGKQVMRYLRRTKDYKLVSKEVSTWNYKDLQMQTLQDVKTHSNPHLVLCLCLEELEKHRTASYSWFYNAC
ncbi:hypothetical protein L3X38_024624 [Prunus dulcis]|uniref:Transposable element protein n=1 Tax=Prunus dulcis TaxID=3755 RepID=A0AAD4Z6K9_PRUDU|nr:hypothetical protein L3X38_024624 [Prunus dulcis]